MLLIIYNVSLLDIPLQALCQDKTVSNQKEKYLSVLSIGDAWPYKPIYL
jgi:hypothetical protein